MALNKIFDGLDCNGFIVDDMKNLHCMFIFYYFFNWCLIFVLL